MWITKTVSLVVTHHFYLSANEVREWFSDLGDIWRVPGEEEFLYFKHVCVYLGHVLVCGMYVVCVYLCVCGMSAWCVQCIYIYICMCRGYVCVIWRCACLWGMCVYLVCGMCVYVCRVCVMYWYVVCVCVMYVHVVCVWCICVYMCGEYMCVTCECVYLWAMCMYGVSKMYVWGMYVYVVCVCYMHTRERVRLGVNARYLSIQFFPTSFQFNLNSFFPTLFFKAWFLNH